jgi:hypothetical protein
MDVIELIDLITPTQRAELNELVRKLGGGRWSVLEDDAGFLVLLLHGAAGRAAYRWSPATLDNAVDPHILVIGGIHELGQQVAAWEATQPSPEDRATQRAAAEAVLDHDGATEVTLAGMIAHALDTMLDDPIIEVEDELDASEATPVAYVRITTTAGVFVAVIHPGDTPPKAGQ